MLSFHSFRALCSTYSRLHHRLPNSFKAAAISSLHLLKSILEGNRYFDPLEIIFRILESGIIFQIASNYMSQAHFIEPILAALKIDYRLSRC